MFLYFRTPVTENTWSKTEKNTMKKFLIQNIIQQTRSYKSYMYIVNKTFSNFDDIS